MSYRHTAIFKLRRRQRGAALMVMLVIMVMGAASFLVSSLSRSGLQIERNKTTAAALAQAKDALIGYAVTKTDYPLGNLPCPDTDNDGISDAGGSTDCPQYIGRLPWKTLGLPDLRDATGERLWYTLSRNVRRYNSVRPINSETTGTLNLSGTYPTGNLIAIVFAPGAIIGSQSRSESQTASCTTTGDTQKESLCAVNYLESNNANPSPGAIPNLNYQSSDTSNPFNDQLISISYDQLFQQVEKRIGNEIKKILNTYYAAWGAYPFAAPFVDPSLPISNYKGRASPQTYYGLLPIDNQSYLPAWNADPSRSFSGGIFGSMNCFRRNGDATYSRWRCCNTNWWDPTNCTDNNITIPSGVTVTITGRLNNVGRGLWRPHHINNICEVRARNSSGTNVLATSLFAPNSVTVTNSLNSDGSANIVFRATGKTGGTTLQRIELRDILDYTTDIRTNSDTSDCSPTPTSPVIPTWLFNDPTYGNNWHQVVYYAVSPGHAPGGGNACNPLPGTPSCLTVNGSSSGNDKQAVVVMTSGALPGKTHPSGTLANYLELENLTPADFIYENKTRASTFNDQVIIVAP